MKTRAPHSMDFTNVNRKTLWKTVSRYLTLFNFEKCFIFQKLLIIILIFDPDEVQLLKTYDEVCDSQLILSTFLDETLQWYRISSFLSWMILVKQRNLLQNIMENNAYYHFEKNFIFQNVPDSFLFACSLNTKADAVYREVRVLKSIWIILPNQSRFF